MRLSPTPRAAALLALVACSALVLPAAVAILAALALLAAAIYDARSIPDPMLRRDVPRVLSRGVRAPLRISADAPGPALQVRQPVPGGLAVEPNQGDGGLDAELLPIARGRHGLPAFGSRTEGTLGLAARYAAPGEEMKLDVYPDLPNARRLALAVRRGRLGDPGLRALGPLGLGTEFESIREYAPDDDIRRVNWRASARMGRPMSNEFRLEQDRDVLCLVDAGRLTAAPLGDRTRLDASLDAVAAVALVADELADRCGGLVFDSRIRRRLEPRRGGGRGLIRALHTEQPSGEDSDYELAFGSLGATKRALVLVFSDLIDATAARSLIAAVPMLARRHAVAIVTPLDPDIDLAAHAPPQAAADAYRMVAALDVLEARAGAAARLRGAGATVVEAAPAALAGAAVRAYVRAKLRARL